jgi:hypothetical protein
VSCGAASAAGGAQIGGSVPGIANGGVGLHIRAANAQWEWLMIVEGPPLHSHM